METDEGSRGECLTQPGDAWGCGVRMGGAQPHILRLSCSGVGVVAAVTTDLDLQRWQVVQPALLQLVAETFLFLFDHGAPHLLQC